MTCKQARKLFSPELEGELEPKHLQWLDAHLATCASCTDERQRFREALDALQELPRHPVPRRFAEDVVEAAKQRRGEAVASAAVTSAAVTSAAGADAAATSATTMSGRWQWAAMLLICAAVMFVLLAWQESRWRSWSRDQGVQQARVAATQGAATQDAATEELAATESLLAELRGVTRQLHALTESVAEQERQLDEIVVVTSDRQVEVDTALNARLVAHDQAHEAALNRALDSERSARATEIVSLREAFSQELSDKLSERWGNVRDGAGERWEQQVAAVSEQLRSGMAAIDERLRTVERGWRRVQPLLARAARISRGELADDTGPSPGVVGAPGEGSQLSSRVPPSAVDWLAQVTEDEVTDRPCRIVRRNGAIRLQLNLDHADAIPMLFALYRAGAPEEQRLALAELDALYGERARRQLAGRREDRGLLSRLFTADPAEDADLEQERVDLYEELWQADSER